MSPVVYWLASIVGCLVALVATGSAVAQAPAAAAPVPASLTACDGSCDGRFDFSKVPPVRPLPRPGLFVIWPTEPGYYSLRDALEGNFRAKPPIQPLGSFGFYQPSFFDTDFRYLDKPDNQQHDFWDPLKRLRLGDDWLLSLGGQSWMRYMHEVDARLLARNNTYELVRTRMYADLWYHDRFRLFAEFIYADSLHQDLEPLVIDINRSDFQNLFAEVKLGELEGKPVQLRVGRQEMLFGSQRLISTLDWANTRRKFQGVRGYRQGEKWDVDLFWVQPVVPHRDHFDSVDNDQNFSGAWVTYRPKKGTFLDFYALNLDQARHVAAGEGGRLGAFNITTFGSRFAGDQNQWLWDVEGMLQFGTWSNQDFQAGSTTVAGGYWFKCQPMTPQVWLSYDWASGESTPGAGTTRSTFHQLFPFGHYYNGYLDLVGRQNIHDLSTQLVFFPAPWVTALAQFHHFRLDTPRDALYNAAGAPIRRDPTGLAGTNVGNEIDLVLSFHLTDHADLLLGWSKLFAGSFIDRSGPAVSPELLYVQCGYRW